MYCTRCGGSGFLNLEQVDDDTLDEFNTTGDHQVILDWIEDRRLRMNAAGGCSCFVAPPCSYCCELVHDVSVCDCCGDGCDWHGQPGVHDWNNPDDPKGCR